MMGPSWGGCGPARLRTPATGTPPPPLPQTGVQLGCTGKGSGKVLVPPAPRQGGNLPPTGGTPREGVCTAPPPPPAWLLRGLTPPRCQAPMERGGLTHQSLLGPQPCCARPQCPIHTEPTLLPRTLPEARPGPRSQAGGGLGGAAGGPDPSPPVASPALRAARPEAPVRPEAPAPRPPPAPRPGSHRVGAQLR